MTTERPPDEEQQPDVAPQAPQAEQPRPEPSGEAMPQAPRAEQPRPQESGGARPERPRPVERSGDRRPDRGRSEGGGEDRGRGRRHFGRRRVCVFCVEKKDSIDYKDPVALRRFLSDRARIEPRRKTGTCAKHQRWLAVALKRARHLALLPYSPEHARQSGAFPVRR